MYDEVFSGSKREFFFFNFNFKVWRSEFWCTRQPLKIDELPFWKILKNVWKCSHLVKATLKLNLLFIDSILISQRNNLLWRKFKIFVCLKCVRIFSLLKFFVRSLKYDNNTILKLLLFVYLSGSEVIHWIFSKIKL